VENLEVAVSHAYPSDAARPMNDCPGFNLFSFHICRWVNSSLSPSFKECTRTVPSARAEATFSSVERYQYFSAQVLRTFLTVDFAIASIWTDLRLSVSTSSSEHWTLMLPSSVVDIYAFMFPSVSPVMNRGIFQSS
jgi:hypothetical protein